MKFVDLGLPSGTLWADRNLGAKRQYDAGVYMSHPKRLHMENATLPSDEQFEELLGCSKKWTIRNGQPGYLIEGINGNSIFIPAVGFYFDNRLVRSETHGYYWSSSYFGNSFGYHLYFESSNIDTLYGDNYYGMSIRLVKSK